MMMRVHVTAAEKTCRAVWPRIEDQHDAQAWHRTLEALHGAVLFAHHKKEAPAAETFRAAYGLANQRLRDLASTRRAA